LSRSRRSRGRRGGRTWLVLCGSAARTFGGARASAAFDYVHPPHEESSQSEEEKQRRCGSKRHRPAFNLLRQFDPPLFELLEEPKVGRGKMGERLGQRDPSLVRERSGQPLLGNNGLDGLQGRAVVTAEPRLVRSRLVSAFWALFHRGIL
jgi:hypothetical protein